jgi:hypothetical protein
VGARPAGLAANGDAAVWVMAAVVFTHASGGFIALAQYARNIVSRVPPNRDHQHTEAWYGDGGSCVFFGPRVALRLRGVGWVAGPMWSPECVLVACLF